MPSWSDALRALIWGQPFGDVYPPRPDVIPPPFDGRTAALDVLKLYLSEIVFYRAGDTNGPPIAFKIDPANIEIEPADGVKDAARPCLTFIPGPGSSEALGLGAYTEESSRDVYGAGTVVQWQAEYIETFQIEVVAPQRAHRRAIVAGIQRWLSPTENMYGLRLRMPTYYDQLVCFVVQRRTLSTDYVEENKKRRRALIEVEMRLTEVALVNYSSTQPTTRVDVKPAGFAFDPPTAEGLADDGTVIDVEG